MHVKYMYPSRNSCTNCECNKVDSNLFVTVGIITDAATGIPKINYSHEPSNYNKCTHIPWHLTPTSLEWSQFTIVPTP